MHKIYYNIDENMSINSFFKGINDKKNSSYIILDTNPKSFVDIFDIAINNWNLDDKLKKYKRVIPLFDKNNIDFKNLDNLSKNDKFEILDFFVKANQKVIMDKNNNYFNYYDAIDLILKLNFNFLDLKISEIVEKFLIKNNLKKNNLKPVDMIYFCNRNNSISKVRSDFLNKKIDLIPTIDDENNIFSEVRIFDFLTNDLHLNKNLPIKNITNKKPITINLDEKFSKLFNILTKKKIPSIIITENKKLYFIISYRDIFKIYKYIRDKQKKKENLKMSFLGQDILYNEEFEMIKLYSNKFLEKISKISEFNELKIVFKNVGSTNLTGHKKKIEINITIYSKDSSKKINVKKSLQDLNDRENVELKKKTQKNSKWNIVELVYIGFTNLELKIKELKSIQNRKNKNL